MTRTRSARPAMLRLEPLEDRTVPATFNVTTTLDAINPLDGRLSLREAITAANKHAGADAIVLPAGVFNITRPGTAEEANRRGDFDVRDSVTITGAGRGLTVVDGRQLDRVFQVIGSAPFSIGVVLERMRVRNGKVEAPGGGVAVTNANLLVRDAAVIGNQATGATGNGGGIFADSAAKIRLLRSTVAGNVAGNFGGGMDASGVTLRDSVVLRNSATDGGGVGASTATLTNCTVSDNAAGGVGGGILTIGTATLTNCTVSGNAAGDDGGGIRGNTANLTRSTVSGNTAGRFGGGIDAGTANLTNSTVSGNTAGKRGGGIIAATANLTNSAVSGNTARTEDGGGIIAATATLTNCTVSGNTAAGAAGGIIATTATLTNSTVSGNTAGGGGFGGGIIARDTATLTNCTVSGNTAGASGGGIFTSGTATLTNCTVSGNTAGFGGGGGIFCFLSDITSRFILRNTIVALNSATGGRDVSGAVTSLGHNLIGTAVNGFTNGDNGDIVGTAGNPINPLLGPLADNGGPTMTHALLAGSPAIDAGNSTEPTDQRGLTRKKDGNGDGTAVVDIGAFER